MAETNIDKFLEWFNKQSLGAFLPLIIFFYSYISRLLSMVFSDTPPGVEGLLTVVWNSFAESERESMVVYFVIGSIMFTLWIIARDRAKKNKDAHIAQIFENIKTISDNSGEVQKNFHDILDKYDDYSSIDRTFAKHIIEPLKKEHLKDIRSTVESSFSKISSYVNAINFESNIIDKERAKIDKDTSELEILKDIEERKRVADEKVNVLQLIFDLVNDASTKIREETKNKTKIAACYYITDTKGISKLLNIKYDGTENTYNAIVYDKMREHKYEVIIVDVHKDNRKVNLILSCSEHQNIDIYSCDVHLDGYSSTRFSCLYIKENRRTCESLAILKLDDYLMGPNYPPLTDYVSVNTFDEIIRKIKKTIRIDAEDKKALGLNG